MRTLRYLIVILLPVLFLARPSGAPPPTGVTIYPADKVWITDLDKDLEAAVTANDLDGGDVTSVYDCLGPVCTNLTPADGSVFDMSNIDMQSTNEGLILGQDNDCSNATALGQVCYDADDFLMYIGDGTTAKSATVGGISEWDHLVDWDQKIMYTNDGAGNITQTTNASPCFLGQASLNDYLDDTDTNAGNTYRVKWVGNPDLYPSHMFLMDGDMNVCTIFAPTQTITSGYPVPEARELLSIDATMHLDVDEWHPTYHALGDDHAGGGTGDAADQTVETSVMHIGSLYFAGSDGGTIGHGLTITGAPTITMHDVANGSSVQGVPPIVTTTNFLNSNTATVGIVVDGWRTGNATNFSPHVQCTFTDDYDDIGMLWRQSWRTMFGRYQAINCGLGLGVWGNNSGSGLAAVSIGASDIGVMFGDRTNGGDILYDSACAGTCTTTSVNMSDYTITHGAIEGADYGDIVAFSAHGRITFVDVRVESSATLKGHSVLLGAIACDGTTGTNSLPAGRAAGSDSECADGDGLGTAPSGTATIGGIWFIGGYIEGDSGFTATPAADWEGLYLGKNADNGGTVYISAKLNGNDDNTIFAADALANLYMDFSHSLLQAGDSFPAYTRLIEQIDNTSDVTWTGDHDFNAATFEVPNSATLPLTCDVGDAYMDTDAPTGTRFHLCESTDTWVIQGDGSGSGVTSVAGCAGPTCDEITAAENAKIDFSGVDMQDPTEGLFLGVDDAAGECKLATANGQICLDDVTDRVTVGDGTDALSIAERVYHTKDYDDQGTTAGIEEAITAACVDQGGSIFGCGTVVMPNELLTVTTTIDVGCAAGACEYHGLRLIGQGRGSLADSETTAKGGTSIEWGGGVSAGNSVLKIHECRKCTFADFEIKASNNAGASPADYGIHFLNRSANSTEITNSKLENLSLHDANVAAIFMDGAAPSNDFKMDGNVFRDIYMDDNVTCFSNTNASTEGTQIVNSWCEDYTTTGFNLEDGHAEIINGHWVDGGAAAYAIAIDKDTVHSAIRGGWFEDDDSHFLKAVDVSDTDAATAVVEGVNMLNTGAAFAMTVLDYDYGGSLTYRDNRYEQTAAGTFVLDITNTSSIDLNLTYGTSAQTDSEVTETIDVTAADINPFNLFDWGADDTASPMWDDGNNRWTWNTYMPLGGGTMTGLLVTDTTGIDFPEGADYLDNGDDCDPGEYYIYADTSELSLKKCNNGALSDLDTTGGGGSPVRFDIQNNEGAGAEESDDLIEIATDETEPGSIFTLPSADKMLIKTAVPWPECVAMNADNDANNEISFNAGVPQIEFDPDEDGTPDVVIKAGEIDVAANATAGQRMELKEQSTLGSNTWAIDLKTVPLSGNFEIVPETDGTLDAATLLKPSSVTSSEILLTGNYTWSVGKHAFTGDLEIPDDDPLAADGEITVDGTDDQFQYRVDAATYALHPLRCDLEITLEDPVANEDVTIGYTSQAITALVGKGVVIGTGSPTIDVTIRHATSRNAAGTAVVSGHVVNSELGENLTIVTAGGADNIPADSFIWLETANDGGTTLTELFVALCYTVDPT